MHFFDIIIMEGIYEKIVNDIVEILKKLANKIVLDEYLEEISRFDYNILTKKDKKEIFKSEKR